MSKSWIVVSFYNSPQPSQTPAQMMGYVLRTVAPQYCLWPTPRWLWDNDSGKGSGPWRTLEVRAWMDKHAIARHYVAADDPDNLQLIPREEFDEICRELVKRPFRCKPVYNEGVWGGEFTRKLRNLPKEMKNCAWVFDLIPLEVSVLVEIGKHLLEIPYLTFVKKEGANLMGQRCVKQFQGFFPVRFNYDDTFHGNGNMSVQVHPTEAYVKQHNNEYGRQDESYYVVEAGHGAKTYLGLKDEADASEFFHDIKASENEHTPVDHDRYVNSVPSAPGVQFLIPAGTIHCSGRNQVVLEIGSLTVLRLLDFY